MTVINNLQNIYSSFMSLTWVQKLLVVVIILLSSAFIFKVLTPDLVPVQTNVLKSVTPSATNLKNIEFRGTYPAVPAQLPVATVEYNNVSQELLQSLLTAFSISASENPQGVWKGSQYEVVKIDEPALYSLSRNSEPENIPDNLENINTQTAVDEATKIIDGIYNFGPKPVALVSEVSILGEDEKNIDGEITHRYVKIPFAFSIEQFPILVEQDTSYAAYIILDSSYVLSKAEFRPYTLTTSTSGNYTTINTNEAIGQVNQNDAAVVFYRYRGPNEADFSVIESGVLNEANIEYRVDLTTNTVVPYYKFSGVVKNGAGYDMESEIITPAIKTDFSDRE